MLYIRDFAERGIATTAPYRQVHIEDQSAPRADHSLVVSTQNLQTVLSFWQE